MQTTQKTLKRDDLSEAEIIDWMNKIKGMCILAGRELWLEKNHIAIEEIYTYYICRCKENWFNNISFKTAYLLIQRALLSQQFLSLEDMIHIPEKDQTKEIPWHIKEKCRLLKKFIGGKWYQSFLDYYSQEPMRWYKVPKHLVLERRRQNQNLSHKKKRILKQISESPELQSLFA